MTDSVNGLVTDAVSQGSISTAGAAASASMAMTYASMADSIGILMHNAVTTQFNTQIMATAATTQTCALIIALGGAS